MARKEIAARHDRVGQQRESSEMREKTRSKNSRQNKEGSRTVKMKSPRLVTAQSSDGTEEEFSREERVFSNRDSVQR